MFSLNSKKYYFIYIASYFSLSILSIAINKIFELPPGVAPNIFVQVVCVAFVIKKLTQHTTLSIREKIALPILFGGTAVTFFYTMILKFPEWKNEHQSLTLFSVLMIFVFNYVIGLATTFYMSRYHKPRS